MANQLNFGNPITNFIAQRMIRLSEKDHSAVLLGEKTVLFGTNSRHNIELWFYHTDGSHAGSIRLAAEDADISLITNIDTDGQAYEYVALNLENIIERIALEPGRYAMSMYCLMDEVSSKNARNKLILREISPSRQEVKLTPEVDDETIANEIYEFVVPSVPRIYAKALIDQSFGKSTGGLEPGEYTTVESISENVLPSSISRIDNAFASDSYSRLVTEVLNRAYYAIVNAMANDYLDPNVQEVELNRYITTELTAVLDDMVQKNEVDPRLQLV